MDVGLYVMRHGEQMPTQNQPVHRSMNLTAAENEELWACRVRVMGDLVRHTMPSARWLTMASLPWLKPKLPSLPPVVATMIQRGLCWLCSVTLTPLKPGEMVEVLGWVRNGPIWLVNIQRWTKHDKDYYLSRLPRYGAGTEVWLDANLILTS